MRKTLSFFIKLVAQIIGKNSLEKLLIYSAKETNINLYIHGLIQNGGISRFESHMNGEKLFIDKILPSLLKPGSQPIFFDVGANIGDFTLELRSVFPNAVIHAFEPVQNTFNLLTTNTTGANIIAHNIGLGSLTGTGELFNTINADNHTIASSYKDVFQEVFKNDNELKTIIFRVDTLDNFCRAEGVKTIDFLKIDVEGHELAVLQGAVNMLQEKQISLIQFEFNSHNVHSRVFLRDFYMLLKGFEFYRIVPGGLIKLGAYNHLNEIFNLQNIVALKSELCSLINKQHIVPSPGA